MKITLELDIDVPPGVEQAIREARTVFWDTSRDRQRTALNVIRLNLYGPGENSQVFVEATCLGDKVVIPDA